MKYRLTFIIILIGLLYPCVAWGQTTLKVQKKLQNVTPDSTYHLSNWILKKTLHITVADSSLPDKYWYFDQQKGTWHLIKKSGLSFPVKEITISYQILPFDMRRTFFTREMVKYRSPPKNSNATDTTKTEISKIYNSNDLFGNARISKSGSLTRGITIGTNQDLSLDSGLRLDLNGKITNDISVLATLTDKNTPIQPDGTTQNLKQFDKVFIQFKSQKSALRLGDINVRMDSSAFARINRKLQGVDFITRSPYGNYNVAASVERGKFRVMKFNGKDGDQGPYLLTGANNEPYIIVLAGTEKVYIDGVLLKRGEQNDYVIDYSLGEITFTNKQIITSNSRITVEFQYLDQNYNRTLIAAQAQDNKLLGGKLSIGTTFMREADSDNPNAQLSLTNKDISLLRKAGNDLSKAVVSGVDSVTYHNPSQYVLYTRKDTVVNGQSNKIYENEPHNPKNIYRVHFSIVGQGNGAYQRVGRKLNGIVYQWVGKGQGQYDTLRTITPPMDHKMISVRSNFHPTKHISMYGEWAGSSLNKNRFSNIGSNNFRNAYLIGGKLLSSKTDIGTFSLNVDQRYTGRNFAFFDRTRPVEFERNWNITNNQPSAEKITQIASGWAMTPNTHLHLSYGQLKRATFSGDRQNITFSSHQKRLPEVDYSIDRIASNDQYSHQKGDWIRQNGDIQYKIPLLNGTLNPDFGFRQETRRQRNTAAANDSLLNTSLQYVEFNPALSYQFSKFSVNAQYSYRVDNRIAHNKFQKQATALTQRYGFTLQPSSVFNSTNSIAFRDKKYTRYFQVNNKDLNSKGVFINSVTNYHPLHRFIDGQFYYDVSTQRKALLQETFINVGPSLGQYVWKDLNHDGIQQIDEFFPAQNANEGTYIKEFIPSDNLIPVIDLHTRLRNTIKPVNLLKNSNIDKNEKLYQIINNLEFNSLFDISETSTTHHLQNVYLLHLNTFRNDSTTIQGRIYWRQQLHWFPDKGKYDIRFSVARNLSQNKETIGISRGNSWNYKFDFRYRLQDNLVIENSALANEHKNISQNLSARNYEISGWEWHPGVNIQLSRKVNTTLTLGIVKKQDKYPAKPVHLTAFNITSQSRFYFGTKLHVYLLLKRRSNHLKGISSGLGTFELTDGAGAGNSWLWNLQAEYKISDLIRASLTYDGHTSQKNIPVQSLRFVVRAVF